MILSKQKRFLLLSDVSTVSQNVIQIRLYFLPTRNIFRIHFGLALSLYDVFIFHVETYMQFDGKVYQHKLCSTYSAFIFILFDRDFISHLHKCKRYNLINMFNDTSRCIDDIFTVANHEFDKHIPDILYILRKPS